MGPFPSLVLRNQFGEVSNNVVEGGSSQLACNFVVDETNGNGLGIRNLKNGPGLPAGIANVYMHTSATAAAGNPNPAVGYIIVEFVEKYAGYVSGTFGMVAPTSGSNVNVSSGLTQFGVYVITSVGTTTPAQWQTLGLPVDATPAVGVSFVAATASAGSGTGVVQLSASAGSGTIKLEPVGDPNLTAQAGYMILQILAPTNTTTTTMIPTQPAANTVIGLTFNMLPLASSQI
jgi:hypothetical protein